MITAAGVGSGLDIESIISQLMSLERQPLVNLETKQNQLEAQLSAFGQFKSSLSEFQSSMNDLSALSAFKVFSATSSDEELFTASASDQAAPGTFDIEVVRLAERHKLASMEIAAGTTFGGGAGDSLSIQVGTDIADTLTVDLSTTSSLTDIKNAINNAADNPGVSASIINGNDGNQKLVLTSGDSGEANALTLSFGGAINAASFDLQTVNDIGGDFSLLDSEIIVDGYTVTRSTNIISDVISGITLNLESALPGTTETLTIERDTEAVKESVQAFVDAFNTLRTTITDLRAENGDLEADSTLFLMDRQLVSVLNTPPGGLALSYMFEAGVSLQKDGTLAINESDLDDQLANNFSGIADLFANDNQGYAFRLDQLVTSYLESDGLLDSRTDGIEARIDSLEDNKESAQYRLELVERRLRSQFSALDALIGQLNTTSQFLTQQLAALPGISDNNNN
jgi:flagellar hook-associated protein 2